MKIVVVGADHLGAITARLSDLGVTEIEHISGRKAAAQRSINFPATAAMILVLVDFLNHNTMQMVKAGARTRAIPVVFANRSWASIRQRLAQGGLGGARLKRR